MVVSFNYFTFDAISVNVKVNMPKRKICFIACAVKCEVHLILCFQEDVAENI